VFIRKKKNKSGTISIQIVDKSSGRYEVIKSLGSSSNPSKIDFLFKKACIFLSKLMGQTTLNFESDMDLAVSHYMQNSKSFAVRVIGPELVFGKIFDSLGFNTIKEELFRHLVITRLVYPGSKLKTIDYLRRYQGVELSVDDIYRFLDKLNTKYKSTVEDLSFQYTKKTLGGNISVVFYDMTTLYFESEDEDDLRKVGFSKDGKHQNPQIFLGLLVGMNGYPIGYEIFEGNIYEGNTLLPVLLAFEKRFNLNKPIVVADAGLLSNRNIELLVADGYAYILGARIKSEKQTIKKKILSLQLSDETFSVIKKSPKERLIISYTDKRARKDKYNRERGLRRLEQGLNKGRLTKSHINNRGYNKYLKLIGKLNIEIDYNKFESDGKWDGLKGYLTNTSLSAKKIFENYRNLWHIEKAFRISKTDLKIRPIYHRLRKRIEAHICISFAAYTIYKELERILKLERANFTAKRAAELTQTTYQFHYQLPDSKKNASILINLTDEQKKLCAIIERIF
jgi:transposase